VQSVSEIRVFDGASELTDGTTIVGFGCTFFGTPVQKTLTVQNVGVAALTLTQLTQASMPAGDLPPSAVPVFKLGIQPLDAAPNLVPAELLAMQGR
jgi:hypothetical protein